MKDYDLNSENLRKQEKTVLLLFSAYSISIFAASIAKGWESWVSFLVLAGLLSGWFVFSSRYRDYRFRTVFTTLMMQLSMILYAMHAPDFLDTIPFFLALVLLTGLYGLKENIYITAGSFTYLIFYHGAVAHRLRFDTWEESVRILCHIVNVFMIEYIVLLWVKKRDERSEQLIKSIETLEEAEQSKNDFLANVSHEIRTPINTIYGMSEIVQQEDNLQRIREDVFHIQNAGRNLMAIVSDILDFSELQSGKMELAEESYNITSTINDVINLTLAKMSEKNIELLISCDADIPSVLLGDEKKIRRVIMNLVGNAIKFTNQGYVSILVSCRREGYGINLSVEVRDSGIGMSGESLERLFTSFNQVDTKRNRKEGGIGLGLAISQALVQKMGGVITVKSKPGKGSIFKFVVPQKVLDEKPVTHVEHKEEINSAVYVDMEQFALVSIRDEYERGIRRMVEQLDVKCRICRNLKELRRRETREQFTHIFIGFLEYQEDKEYFDRLAERTNLVLVIDEREERMLTNPNIIRIYKPLYVLPIVAVLNNNRVWSGKSGRLVCQGRFAAPGAHVLAVDDNEMNLKILEGLLCNYGVKATLALSGQEALKKIETMDYDFVFMDHMMPGMDGVETLHRIRRKAGTYYQRIPIVALTANAVAGSREMFLSEGFSDFIEKPIEISVLERVLRRNLPAEKLTFPEDEAFASIVREPRAEEAQKTEEAAPAVGDLDVERGILYCGGKDKYRSVLRKYARSGEETEQKLKELYEEENWKDYTITVHAVKSSMQSIGAVCLSDLARISETAGREGRIAEIRENHETLLSEYDRIMRLLKSHPWVGAKGKETSRKEEFPELDEESFDRMTSDMEEAMYDLDGEKMLRVFADLQKFQYAGFSLREELSEVKDKIEGADYMSAVSLLEKLRKKMKKEETGGGAECGKNYTS